MPDPTPKRTAEFVAAVRHMLDEGASYGEISRALGASMFVVRLADIEGVANVSRKIAPEKATEILRLARNGVPLKTIAKALRVSEGGVRGLVEREIGEGGCKSPIPSEGGEKATGQAPAVAPNSIEASLIARGVRPEMARASAKAWRDRHARKNEARGR